MKGLKSQAKMDEFAWVLLAGLLFIFLLVIIWTPSPEPVPLVEPKSLTVTLGKNTTYSFYITINGTHKGKLSNVTLTPLGEISTWISFDKNNFDITDSEKVRATINIPYFAGLKTYTGSILVKSKGGEVSLPITISVVNVTIAPLNSRPIFLGDISVRYIIGSETLASKENIEVTKGTFTQTTQTVFISMTPEKLKTITSGYIELKIEETNKGGNLIVYFNDKEVFNQRVADTITIPIDKSLINTTNTIIVKTTSPWWKFWSPTFYKIKSVSFGVRYVDISEIEKSFDLEKVEIDNFKHFQLIGFVKDYSRPLNELKIKINNQLVYSNIPPIVAINQTIEKDLFGNRLYLKPKENTISFSFEKESFYQLEDAFLYVFYY